MLLRGSVFFIGMCLWGSQRVPNLKYSNSTVLPSMLLVSIFQFAAIVRSNAKLKSVFKNSKNGNFLIFHSVKCVLKTIVHFWTYREIFE